MLLVKENSGSKHNQALVTLSEYDYQIQQSSVAREHLREALSQSKGNYYEQPVIQAIKKDDASFFNRFYKDNSDIKNFVENTFAFPFKNFSTEYSLFSVEELKYIKAYHLLLTAIFENSPEVVEFFLNNIENPDIFTPKLQKEKQGSSFYYMDPLSEALINSMFVLSNPLSDEKNKALTILDSIMNHSKTDLRFKSFIGLSPMEIAVLTGQIDQVKKLEARDVSLPTGELWNTGVTYVQHLEKQGLKQTYKHLTGKGNFSSCQQNFVN